MSGTYRLTVPRPHRLARITAPDVMPLRDAMAQEHMLTRAMAQPGANQMIGYRAAAQMDAERAQEAYSLARQQHDTSLAEMREQDMEQRAQELQDQRAHALRTAAINNPAGAAASGDPLVYELISPEMRQRYASLVDAQIAQRGRVGAGSRAASDTGEVRPRDQARLDAARVGVITRAITNERTRLRQEIDGISRSMLSRAEQASQIAKAQKESAAFIAGLQAQLTGVPAPQVDEPRATATPPGTVPPAPASVQGTRANPLTGVTPQQATQLPPGTWYRGTDGALRQRAGQ